jgi:hypothetical protein
VAFPGELTFSSVREAGEVRRFATDPDGGRLLLVTANKLFHVGVQKP